MSAQNCIIFDSIRKLYRLTKEQRSESLTKEQRSESLRTESNMAQFWSDIKFGVSLYFANINERKCNGRLCHSVNDSVRNRSRCERMNRRVSTRRHCDAELKMTRETARKREENREIERMNCYDTCPRMSRPIDDCYRTHSRIG